jgi:hypothetical protein
MQSVEQTLTQDVVDSERPVVARVFLVAERVARPYLGWAALIACMGLSALPAVALHENDWLALGSLQTGVDSAGPAAVATLWLLWGWRQPRSPQLGFWRVILALITGWLVVSQTLMGWIPGPFALWQAATTGDWPGLGLRVEREWLDATARTSMWWQGVRMGGAAQDNLVFAWIAAGALWCLGLTVAWAARRTRQGYAAALPSLWLLGLVLLYSTGGRWVLIVGVALTVALQLVLDQLTLQQRWGLLQLDYSPAVFADRALVVAGATALVATLAAVTWAAQRVSAARWAATGQCGRSPSTHGRIGGLRVPV